MEGLTKAGMLCTVLLTAALFFAGCPDSAKETGTTEAVDKMRTLLEAQDKVEEGWAALERQASSMPDDFSFVECLRSVETKLDFKNITTRPSPVERNALGIERMTVMSRYCGKSPEETLRFLKALDEAKVPIGIEDIDILSTLSKEGEVLDLRALKLVAIWKAADTREAAGARDSEEPAARRDYSTMSSDEIMDEVSRRLGDEKSHDPRVLLASLKSAVDARRAELEEMRPFAGVRPGWFLSMLGELASCIDAGMQVQLNKLVFEASPRGDSAFLIIRGHIPEQRDIGTIRDRMQKRACFSEVKLVRSNYVQGINEYFLEIKADIQPECLAEPGFSKTPGDYVPIILDAALFTCKNPAVAEGPDKNHYDLEKAWSLKGTFKFPDGIVHAYILDKAQPDTKAKLPYTTYDVKKGDIIESKVPPRIYKVEILEVTSNFVTYYRHDMKDKPDDERTFKLVAE